MTPEEQLNPEVTLAEIGAALQVLYPETYNRIGSVLQGAKRLAIIQIAKNDSLEDHG